MQPIATSRSEQVVQDDDKAVDSSQQGTGEEEAKALQIVSGGGTVSLLGPIRHAFKPSTDQIDNDSVAKTTEITTGSSPSVSFLRPDPIFVPPKTNLIRPKHQHQQQQQQQRTTPVVPHADGTVALGVSPTGLAHLDILDILEPVQRHVSGGVSHESDSGQEDSDDAQQPVNQKRPTRPSETIYRLNNRSKSSMLRVDSFPAQATRLSSATARQPGSSAVRRLADSTSSTRPFPRRSSIARVSTYFDSPLAPRLSPARTCVGLAAAAQRGNWSDLEAIVSKDRSVVDHADTVSGSTLLIHAAFHGRITCVRGLLRLRASVNRANWAGSTALICAADRGHCNILDVLLKRGAKVDIRDGQGLTATMWAAERGHEGCAARLIKSLPSAIKTQDSRGFSALLFAACRGRDRVVRVLLDANADPSVRTPDGGTALMMASFHGHVACTQMLIARGADVAMTGAGSGSTAIHCASQNGHDVCVTALLSARADVNVANSTGSSPIILAACHGHARCVRTLLRAQADVGQTDDYGRTALMWATYKEHDACMSLLQSAERVNRV